MSKSGFAALSLGALTVFGFAPLRLFPLPFITLALLFVLWRAAKTPRQAAWLGWWWGEVMISTVSPFCNSVRRGTIRPLTLAPVQ